MNETDLDVLLIGQSDVAKLLPLAAAIDIVESAFRRYAAGELPEPGVLAAHVDGGGFHVKTAVWHDGSRRYFAAKTNANFPGNPARGDLPTIQGLVILFDAADGRPLAVLDSIEITVRRTAAATAAAAKHLARHDSRTATICGCGAQAGAQLHAIRTVLPIERCFAVDVDPSRAAAFVAAAEAQGVHARTADIVSALSASDVVVTCTPSRRPLFAADAVRPGTFVAAVGADNPEKQELDPALFARATVVVDILEQCAIIGELHHALAAGVITRADVHTDLGGLVLGRAAGRRAADEITVFDSTGTALQDVAVAAAVYGTAKATGAARRWTPVATVRARLSP